MKSNRRRKQTARSEPGGLSRREFARGATVAAAAIAAIPGSILGAAALVAPATAVTGGRTRGSAPTMPQQPGAAGPKLSAEAEAEVGAKVSEILRRYGDRLDEAQKADIRRLMREGQEPLEALRAFPLANSDEPATILHLSGTAHRAAATPPATAKPPAKPGT